MSFDKNNSGDLLSLKNEVSLDPVGVGYQPITNTIVLLNLLNDSVNNPGSEVSTARNFSGFDLLESCLLSSGEYDVVVDSSNKIALIQTLFNLEDQSIPIRFKNELLNIFTSGLAPTIRAGIIAEATSKLSRAEVLFGDDTIINKQDWTAARDS